MEKFQSKIKSVLLIGLFMLLAVGFIFSAPTPAVASVEVVSTQTTVHSQIVNVELADTVQVESDMLIVTESLDLE